ATPRFTAGRVNSASCGVRSKNSAGRRCSKQASNSHGREAGTGWYSAKRTSCLSKPSGKRWTGSGSKRASHTRAGSLATPAAWKFLSQRREQLRDYRDALRNQLPANKALNGLGAMEACVNRVLAARMKKRTMCWTIAGADAMARLRALRANGELQEWLDRQLSGPARVPTRTWHRVAKAARESCTGEWLQKNVPALAGPHAS